MTTNDNDPAPNGALSSLPDAHGHAALLLVESLIHGLCERSILTAADAVEIADRAVDVQQEIAETADGASALMWQSHSLLTSIAASLSADAENGSIPSHQLS